VELTLLPIAAILFLLSGVSAPAHASGKQQSTAALMRELFGGSDTAHGRIISASSAALRAHVRQFGRQQDCSSPADLVVACGQNELTQRVLSTAARAFDRKQYRTRFGFADGAYLAAGPPLSDTRTELHWLSRA
jgi:hypothetical protein